MSQKREAADIPVGGDDARVRTPSIKITRISEVAENIGEFASLAATPATSLAPMAVTEGSAHDGDEGGQGGDGGGQGGDGGHRGPGQVPKRTRGGARSLPPSLQPKEASPARTRAFPPDLLTPPHSGSNFEVG